MQGHIDTIEALKPQRPWTATYRLQLNRGFTFDDVAAVAPYLAGLGVSHVYLSPVLQAAPGSSHGYDGADPTRLSRELGGAEAFGRACRALEAAGLGLLLDIVPNHLAAVYENPWWRDVLTLGPRSAYARYFDLRWQGEPPHIRLPVLSDEPSAVVQRGELRLDAAGPHGTVLRYYDAAFPLSPETRPDATRAEALNRDPAALLELLDRQHYRLQSWQTAATAIDYRRFFDINGLVGLRVEDGAVFDDVHRLVLELVRDGRVAGLRIDHIDGLRDPERYLQRLRAASGEAPVYVEKILAADESLPARWPVRGTTGYDFLNKLNGLFVDASAEQRLGRLYRDLTGDSLSYDDVLAEKKRLVLEQLFGGDLSHLADLFVAACPDAGRCRSSLEALLRELTVALPVYRTYLQPERDELDETDRRLIEAALQAAAGRLSGLEPWLLDSLRSVLLLEQRGAAETEFVLAWQQLSGPAMAKGAEDTAFYCYNRLVSLNEVGGDPGRFGVALGEFHAFCSHNAESWPHTLLTTSTHDTKRGEDVRLRIDALSELPDEWESLVTSWLRQHERYLQDGLPDHRTVYLLYQTLAGAWPIEEERVQAYMLKAARESKLVSSWRRPDAAYEAALRDFIAALFRDEAFRQECAAFAAKLAAVARPSSLSQTLLKLTAPGVPDFYQGSELWQLSLVDPDNRRPVDYAERRHLLAEAMTLTATQVLQQPDSGLPKLWLIWKTLSLRNQRPGLFEAGYLPLYADGPLSECVVAFRRGDGLAVVAPRFHSRLSAGWDGTTLTLPGVAWRNWLTDATVPRGSVRLDELLSDFPVALLVQGDRS